MVGDTINQNREHRQNKWAFREICCDCDMGHLDIYVKKTPAYMSVEIGEKNKI